MNMAPGAPGNPAGASKMSSVGPTGSLDLFQMMSVRRGPGTAVLSDSVVRAPVAVITGHQASSDEQDQVHEPPDPQTSQSKQLPHCGASVTQTKPIHAKTAQEEGVQQCGDEVVSSVPEEKTSQLNFNNRLIKDAEVIR